MEMSPLICSNLVPNNYNWRLPFASFPFSISCLDYHGYFEIGFHRMMFVSQGFFADATIFERRKFD